MNDTSIWWLVTGALVAAELLSGTFYLLMLAIGAAAAALSAHLGLGLNGQIVTAALVGAVGYGATFIGIVSLVLTMAGRYYPGRPAKMMGRMTLAYGSAQIVGPAVTGWLAGRFGSYEAGLYLAAAVMAIGTVLLLALKGVERRDRPAEAPAVVC